MKKEIAQYAKRIAKQAKDQAHQSAVRITKTGLMAKEMIKPHAARIMKEVKKEIALIEKKARAEAKKEMAKMKKKMAKEAKRTAKSVKKATKKGMKKATRTAKKSTKKKR